MDAIEILPVEIWHRILGLLPTSTLITAREVCFLWANICQQFVMRGHIKTDQFHIRRLYEEVQEEGTEVQLVRDTGDSDEFFFRTTSRPFILTGVGIHGPYLPGLKSLRNLGVSIKLYNQYYQVVASRYKICKVKIPNVIQPIFFDKPVLLEEDKLFLIVAEFDHEDNPEVEKGRGGKFRYPSECRDIDLGLTESEKFTIEFVNCENHDYTTKCHNISGQLRLIYFWPVATLQKSKLGEEE